VVTLSGINSLANASLLIWHQPSRASEQVSCSRAALPFEGSSVRHASEDVSALRSPLRSSIMVLTLASAQSLAFVSLVDRLAIARKIDRFAVADEVHRSAITSQ
jgi:hypothetical protein